MKKAKKIIDLTMPISEGMQTFPVHWHPFVEITQLGRHGIEDRETRKVILGTHSGTHVDAPRHFIEEGETLDNISLDVFVGKASVLDLSNFPNFHEIKLKELQEVIGGRSVDRLLCRFDWDKKALGTNKYYTDHAFFSEGCCEWLVKKGCRLLAMDTPQPDNPLNGRGSENDAQNHKILLGSNVILAEYLVNLDSIMENEVELIVAPIKIKDGDGAPARCFAIEY